MAIDDGRDIHVLKQRCDDGQRRAGVPTVKPPVRSATKNGPLGEFIGAKQNPIAKITALRPGVRGAREATRKKKKQLALDTNGFIEGTSTLTALAPWFVARTHTVTPSLRVPSYIFRHLQQRQ
jgi:hypothetical protein